MINISLASDSKYCRHMCVAMASVLENASDNVCFYIFDGGISDVQKNKVEKILKNHPESSISYLKVENKIVEKLPLVDKHLSSTNLFISIAIQSLLVILSSCMILIFQIIISELAWMAIPNITQKEPVPLIISIPV